MNIRNRLDQETSPYLLLHKDNPVHWQPWDEEALAIANDTQKPILLSIGYSACHWCHVMAEESFEDPETGQLMNELFVNIKVDREERPDLDNIYQSALASMGQRRGWPLTMFLTPTGEPFYGGTYFPPITRQEAPSFKSVLTANSQVFRNNPGKVVQEAVKRVNDLTDIHRGHRHGEISREFLNHVAGQILDGMDSVYGGFGLDAKFPQTMLLELLWNAYGRTGHTPFRDAVLRSAEYMCLGGIYDHLGGGFHRYTIDDRWLVPHFEKMLYDNALIISLLILLWRETKNPLFSHCIEQTAQWMIREMTTAEGGFAASIAADSEGYSEGDEETDSGEGAFYVWTESGIDSVLTADEARLFKRYHDVTTTGNWEGETILNRTDHPYGRNREIEDRLTRLREKLFAVREHRPRPAIDDKVLADWNGLAIAALAEAGVTFNRQEWIDAAVASYHFVQNKMSADNVLHHAYRQGQCTPMALLDDYANMAHAAISLYQISADLSCLQQAQDWVAMADQHYWDADGSGYFYTADNARSIILRTKTASETATPSGNGMMVRVLAHLHALTAVESYRQCAEATIAAFSTEAQSDFVGMASLLNHSGLLGNLLQIVVVSNQGAEETEHIFRVINQTATPARLVLNLTPDTALPEAHPASAKTLINNQPTVYVCSGNTCQMPITEVAALESLLAESGGQL